LPPPRAGQFGINAREGVRAEEGFGQHVDGGKPAQAAVMSRFVIFSQNLRISPSTLGFAAEVDIQVTDVKQHRAAILHVGVNPAEASAREIGILAHRPIDQRIKRQWGGLDVDPNSLVHGSARFARKIARKVSSPNWLVAVAFVVPVWINIGRRGAGRGLSSKSRMRAGRPGQGLFPERSIAAAPVAMKIQLAAADLAA